ncbi:MAG: c-type cytochrome [Chloracidobacterium sp.]|nr:c-type cytochrome [Chloracidobacterium sp.]
MILARALITIGALTILAIGASCPPPPGKPAVEERWTHPSQVMDFRQLYAQNCAGCHGADGRLGGARPLNDPVYLAFAGENELRRVVAKGVPGTAMPGFAQTSGGNLTDKQIDSLVEGMDAQWGRPEDFKNVALPPYRPESAAAGDPRRGAATYLANCSQCHGADGKGGLYAGAITDPNYLTLVSDQSLRSTIVAGRPDLGMPEWRSRLPGQPMSAQEISDVAAWLASKRPSPAAAPSDLHREGAARIR